MALPLRKLTAVHIEALEAELQREGRQRHRDSRGAALSAQTVLHVHRTLSQALEHAVKTEVLFRNPALQVRPPRPPGREIKILTKPEIAQVLRACEGRGFIFRFWLRSRLASGAENCLGCAGRTLI